MAAEKKDDKKVKGSYVAEGCAITTKKGIKVGGDVITAEILAGGKDALTALTKKGLIEAVK